MDRTTTIMLILLLFVGGGLGWYVKPPERIYHTEHQERQIDSLTTALTNTQASKESLQDSLENTSEAFQEYVENHEGDVATLTTIRGRLNTRIDELQDSLQQAQMAFTDLPVDSTNAVQDTTIEVSRTFGNELFEVRSQNEFQNNQFRDQLFLEQLRDIRLDLALLVSEDKRTVESVATSPDFDSLRVSAQTTIEPEKKLHWSILVSIGILIREAANIIFN